MRTLVIGMGNCVLSDNGVGLLVARELAGMVPGVEVTTAAMIGLGFIDEASGYDKLCIIDATTNGGGRYGEWRKLTNGSGSLHLFSSHGLSFPDILRLGRDLGYDMPKVVVVYGIEIGPGACFGESPSSELQKNIRRIAQEIASDIKTGLDR